jgi:hypothetical protein
MASPTIELLRPDGTLLVRSEGPLAQWLIRHSELLKVLWEGRNTPTRLHVELPDHLLADPAVSGAIYRLFSTGPMMYTSWTTNQQGRPVPRNQTPVSGTTREAIQTVLGFFMLPEQPSLYSRGPINAPPEVPITTRLADRARFVQEQTPNALRRRHRATLIPLLRRRENILEELEFEQDTNEQDRLEERLNSLDRHIAQLEANPPQPEPYPYEPGTEGMTNAQYRAFVEEKEPRNRLERDPLTVPLGLFNGEGGRRRRARKTRKHRAK